MEWLKQKMCRHGLQQKHSTIIEAMYEWRSNMSGIYIYIYMEKHYRSVAFQGKPHRILGGEVGEIEKSMNLIVSAG